MLILKKVQQDKRLKELYRRSSIIDDKVRIISRKTDTILCYIFGFGAVFGIFLSLCISWWVIIVFGGIIFIAYKAPIKVPIIDKFVQANKIHIKNNEKIEELNKNRIYISSDFEICYMELFELKKENRLDEVPEVIIDEILNTYRETKETRTPTKEDKLNLFVDMELSQEIEISIFND